MPGSTVSVIYFFKTRMHVLCVPVLGMHPSRTHKTEKKKKKGEAGKLVELAPISEFQARTFLRVATGHTFSIIFLLEKGLGGLADTRGHPTTQASRPSCPLLVADDLTLGGLGWIRVPNACHHWPPISKKKREQNSTETAELRCDTSNDRQTVFIAMC